MNPETTINRTAGIDVHFLLAGNPIPRVAHAHRPALNTSPADPVEETTVTPAAYDRQDSLAFLHKLVMG